jgi:hypothetical protein
MRNLTQPLPTPAYTSDGDLEIDEISKFQGEEGLKSSLKILVFTRKTKPGFIFLNPHTFPGQRTNRNLPNRFPYGYHETHNFFKYFDDDDIFFSVHKYKQAYKQQK